MKDDACESVHTCKHCKEEYMDWIPQSRYCSDDCRKEAAKKRKLLKGEK